MSQFYYFMIEGFSRPFGYAHSDFVKAMRWPSGWSVDHEQRLLTLHAPQDFQKRTKLMNDTLRSGHEKGEIAALRWWSDELFPVYASNGEHVLDMDGCGVDLFGVVNFAVHMLASVNTKDGLKLWVPRRSKTKMSYPGMLDNTVGGSLSSGERPIDCIVRESAEEASLPEDYVRDNVKACGTLSYQMSRADDGSPGCQHQVQYLYEIELTEDMVPRPFDGEVEEFTLKTLDEVRDALARGKFKLNCAMTWMAYLIRHGVVNAENEPNLVEISSRLHRKHDLFIV